MRTILMLFLVISRFHCAGEGYAQGVGKEGNRAAGLVFRSDGTTFPEGEAIVWVFGREDVRDSANADGVFYIVIPKNVYEFQLIYRAPGYFAFISPNPLYSKYDPIKVAKVLLLKKDPNDKALLSRIDVLLDTELAVYKATKSADLRRSMREELMKLSDSIEIPPIDPTHTMLERERIMKINARISIDTVVVKMK